jgi:hypothetical protein
MRGRVWRAVVFAGSVSILLLSLASPVQGSSSNSNREDKGARHRPVSSLSASARSLAPTANEGSVDLGNALVANFNGVSSLDSEITNFGAKFEPPDQGLCVGNGFVVEMVNSAWRVYDLHGNTLHGPQNVNEPFHEDFLAFTSDPRCHYDAATNTWFATILFLGFDANGNGTDSHLDIAYNTSGDPRTNWSVFRIDTTDAGAPASSGCPCFGDQPRLGIDASNIYVSQDEFSINGPQYNGAEIIAVSKADLVSHNSTPHFVRYSHLNNPDGTQALAVEPALTFGSANAEYFLESLDVTGAGTGSSQIAVWSLTHVDRVRHGATPTLSTIVIGSEAYAIPPAALQKGTNDFTLDSGDDRMQQTQFINGDIWGELTTAVRAHGDGVPRAGAAWFRVRPQLAGDSLGGATTINQGYVTVTGGYVIYPALQVDGQGRGAMVFTVSSHGMFPSAAYSRLSGDSTQFGAPIIAAPGSGPYVNNSHRWGDYSWAVLDQPTDTVWMATEYMPPKSSQTTTGRRPWGTRVIAVELA